MCLAAAMGFEEQFIRCGPLNVDFLNVIGFELAPFHQVQMPDKKELDEC